MYVLIVLFSIQYLVLLVCCRLVILVTIILDFFLYFLLLFLSLDGQSETVSEAWH